MAIALISLILLISLVLIAIKTGLNKERRLTDEHVDKPTIHASGIYSIVRETPRRMILSHKPRTEDITQYLSGINEDIDGTPLSEADKTKLAASWAASMEENIAAIERGDLKGVEFYYYDFAPVTCPVCKRFLSKGKYVTREEIFKFPAIIPPLHLGCTCRIHPHHGKENLRETTELGMLPLFKHQAPPVLPEWKTITKTVKA
jgi:hypothetical protein